MESIAKLEKSVEVCTRSPEQHFPSRTAFGTGQQGILPKAAKQQHTHCCRLILCGPAVLTQARSVLPGQLPASGWMFLPRQPSRHLQTCM